MTRGFNWTPRRDSLLRELKRQGLSRAEMARAIGCDVEHVKIRVGELMPPRKPADMTIVPRPVRRPSTLIDLSTAPSLMEQRYSAGERHGQA